MWRRPLPSMTRADSGFYAHTVVAACREMDVRFSITIRHRGDTRGGLDSHSLLGYPVPDQAGRRAGAAHCCPAPSSPDTAITPSSPTAMGRRWNWRPIIGHAEVENAIRDLKYGVGLNHMPSARFAANGAWLAVQVMAHNLARWTARIGLGP